MIKTTKAANTTIVNIGMIIANFAIASSTSSLSHWVSVHVLLAKSSQNGYRNKNN